MKTLAAIFQHYGPAFRAQCGDQLPAQQRAAMVAIEQCRTAALGGQVYTCPACAATQYMYHSCRNRHCAACQQGATQTWLTQQQHLLLPVPYFLVTFTLPAQLRTLAQQHQRRIYALLFRSSATALQQLAADPRFLGGQIGMVGVLQTWTRDVRYHPHVHYLVPAGARSLTDATWLPAKGRFLVHVKPLAKLFQGKMRAALRQMGLAAHVPKATWTTPWVVDCRPVGRGPAALKYLAPYIFRVALSNNRIVGVTHDQVTFRYRVRATKHMQTCTLPVERFIRRFLQHVLPKGFVKVRYVGLFSPGHRQVLAQVRELLGRAEAAGMLPASSTGGVLKAPSQDERGSYPCPVCGAVLQLTGIAMPTSRSPPRLPR